MPGSSRSRRSDVVVGLANLRDLAWRFPARRAYSGRSASLHQQTSTILQYTNKQTNALTKCVCSITSTRTRTHWHRPALAAHRGIPRHLKVDTTELRPIPWNEFCPFGSTNATTRHAVDRRKGHAPWVMPVRHTTNEHTSSTMAKRPFYSAFVSFCFAAANSP